MLRSIAVYMAVAMLLVGCGSDDGGSPSNPPQVAAPSGLVYSSPIVATEGSALAAITPTVQGTVTSYAVSPALPAGLSINTSTGVISGTPTSATPEATYTITASNSGGNTTFALRLTVNPAAPSGLSYAGPLNATVGTAIAPLTPTVTGTVATYSVAPALPAGLSLDATTGVISGTPSAASPQATYTVTAQNVTGDTTYELSITVVAPTVTTAQGVFYYSLVQGLGFSSGSQSGVTDADGQFTYEIVDETVQGVTFSVGAVTLGHIEQAKPLVTPSDFAPQADVTSPEVLNRVRFLMMLDEDGDPTNGIAISEQVQAAAESWPQVDFTTEDLPAALAEIADSARAADGGEHAIVSAAVAEETYTTSFRCLYEGVFAGQRSGGTPGSNRVALRVSHDQGVWVLGDGPLMGEGLALGLNAGLLTPSATAGFTATRESLQLAATFTEPNRIVGQLSGPLSDTVSLDRIGGDPDAVIRFVADVGDPFEGDPLYGFAELNIRSDNTLSGAVHFVNTNQTLPITGSISGSTLTGAVGTLPIAGTYIEGRLGVTPLATADGSVEMFFDDATSCRLR